MTGGSEESGLRRTARLISIVPTVASLELGYQGESRPTRTDLTLPVSIVADMVHQLLDQDDHRVVVVVTRDDEIPTLDQEDRSLSTGVHIRLYASDAALLDDVSLSALLEKMVNESFVLPQSPSTSDVVTIRTHLSPRELGVVEGLAAGLSNKQLSKALGLSPSTIKTLRARIYSKLGVTNSAGAVAKVLREGLLVRPDEP